ncbi:MAG: hypothetical protein QM802_02460 [Agriterribacter sp.]
MKYELVLLESIFSNQFNNREKDAEQELQRNYVLQFEAETIRIEAVFLNLLFSAVPDAARKRYIRHHQQRLQFIAEKVYRYVQLNKTWLNTVEALSGYQSVQYAIEQLLGVIEMHYGADMSMDSVAPSNYNQKVTDDIKNALPEIQQQLEVLKIDPVLAKLLLESFEQFAQRSLYRLSCYGQIYMMRDIKTELLTYRTTVTNSKGHTKWLIEMLCGYNFNRLSFYKYCREWVIKYFDNEKDKLYLYTRCGKFFSRLSVQTSYGWNLQRITITAMLKDYFRDQFLAEKRRIEQEILLNGGATPGVASDKLAVGLTVDQLGLFIRLMHENEILKSKSIASLIRFFVHHTSTVGKDPMIEYSYDHLKNSYSRSTIQTIDKVDQYLQSMAMLLRKMKLDARKMSRPQL